MRYLRASDDRGHLGDDRRVRTELASRTARDRACPGHPRLEATRGEEDVGARHKAGHGVSVVVAKGEAIQSDRFQAATLQAIALRSKVVKAGFSQAP